MARLPIPGSDSNTWGIVLNDYLNQAHNADGTLKDGSVSSSAVNDGALPQAKIQNLTSDLSAKAAASHTHPISDVTNLQTSLNAKLDASQRGVANGVASLDSTTKVPNAQLPLTRPPVSLTDGTTITTDASLGTLFRVTIAGNRTLAAPTNPTDGQRILWEITATGANRTLTLATGAGAFAFGADIVAITATGQNLTDYIGTIYNATANRHRVIAYIKGYS